MKNTHDTNQGTARSPMLPLTNFALSPPANAKVIGLDANGNPPPGYMVRTSTDGRTTVVLDLH